MDLIVNMSPIQVFDNDTKYLFKRLCRRFHGEVRLSISKEMVDIIVADFHHRTDKSPTERSTAFELLRPHVQVMKLWSNSDFETPLKKEVDILKLLQPCEHPSIVKLIDVAEDYKWYTMPTYAGGDLFALVSVMHAGPKLYVPQAFAWHVAAQLASALLFVHFGIDQHGVQQPDWPVMIHNDLHLGNFFFDIPGGSYGNYPNIVLGDFGKGSVLEERAPEHKIKEFFEQRETDVIDLTKIMKEFNRNGGDKTFTIEVRKLIQEAVRDGNSNQESLLSFIKKAQEERDRLYKPLSPEVLNYLNKQVLVDEDLDIILTRLPQATEFEWPFRSKFEELQSIVS